MNKKIYVFTLFFISLGLFAQLIAIFDFTAEFSQYTFQLIKVISPKMDMTFISNNIFVYRNFDTGFHLNFLSLTIYIIGLVGLLLYKKTKGIEIRLLRFSVSVLLATQFANFLIGIIFLVTPIPNYDMGFIELSLYIIEICIQAGWGYFAFKYLKKISHNIEFQIQENKFVKTPLPQRLLHHVIDVVLSLFIFSQFIVLIGGSFLEVIEKSMGQRVAGIILAIFARLLYFILFEMVFRATPAKFITGSQVINLKGKTLTFKQALIRTLMRHVPLNSISFLGEGSGWHDTVSSTQVIKEKEYSSIPLKKHLLIFPLLGIIALLSYFGYIGYKKFEYYTFEKTSYNLRIESIKAELDHLTTNHIIKLNNINNNYPEQYYYLKTEKIEGDSILFSSFKMQYNNSDLYDRQQAYIQQQSKTEYYKIQKYLLYNCYIEDFDEYTRGKRESHAFFNDNDKYEINDIQTLYSPLLETSGGSYYNGNISLSYKNNGDAGEIIEINTIKGDLVWETPLPVLIASKSNYNNVSINAKCHNKFTPYVFQIAIKGANGSIQYYEISGHSLKNTIKKIYK